MNPGSGDSRDSSDGAAKASGRVTSARVTSASRRPQVIEARGSEPQMKSTYHLLAPIARALYAQSQLSERKVTAKGIEPRGPWRSALQKGALQGGEDH